MKLLITGGSGTLGKHIIKNINKEKIDVFNYDLIPFDTGCTHIQGNIESFHEVKKVFNDVNPDLVIHAAACKHIHICEFNPSLALKTNIRGTSNLIQCASRANVKKFLHISSDKAVEPSSIYGMTKFLNEQEIAQASRDYPEIKFNSVRFGNLIGSSGSVIRIWEDQIKNNITPVLNKNVDGSDILKFMLLPSEAALFCINCLNSDLTGKIFIKSSNVYNIRTIISLLTKQYSEAFCKDYEKKYEQLFSSSEAPRVTFEENGYILHQNKVSDLDQTWDVNSQPCSNAEETLDLLTREKSI